MTKEFSERKNKWQWQRRHRKWNQKWVTKSFFENGFPILKEKNLPFSLFLSTKFVSNDSDSDFMDWKTIKELYKNKGEISQVRITVINFVIKKPN